MASNIACCTYKPRHGAVILLEHDEVTVIRQAVMLVMAVQHKVPVCTWEAEERHRQRWRPEPLHRTAPQIPQTAE